MAPIAIAMLPRMSAKPINRLLRASVEAMPPSSSMMEVAFCSISLASGAASVASSFAAGCSSMVWAIASALSCALRNSSSSGLACFQSSLVLLDRPLAREMIHLGAMGLDVLPERRAFGLEYLVAGDQPAAQRCERRINPRHHVACGHGGRNPKVDRPIGGFADGANLDDGGPHHAGQQNAEHAEAENQSSADIQMQKCHGGVPPVLESTRMEPIGKIGLRSNVNQALHTRRILSALG